MADTTFIVLTPTALREAIAAGGVEALRQVGITSGEISKSDARKNYGRWFSNAVKEGRLRPSRMGRTKSSTQWFSVAEILALQASERVEGAVQVKQAIANNTQP